jgi:DUF971 family protein
MSDPIEIKLHQQSRILEITYDDGSHFNLSCEYLRVFSPSAEVRGHGGETHKLVPGKKNVSIRAIEPVGSYAVKLIFDDGHKSGLYTWEFLYELGKNHENYWHDYLQRLENAHLSR